MLENPSIDNPMAHTDVALITDPLTCKVVDLGNALYALMMRTFAQVFSPAPLPRELRVGLSAAATEIMYAMSFVGEAATRLPAGPAHPGVNGGLTFALSISSGQLVQRCAAQILGERVRELAGAAAKLESSVALLDVSMRLTSVAERFEELHEKFEEHLTIAVDNVARIKTAPPAPVPVAAKSDDPNVARTRDITLRFDGARLYSLAPLRAWRAERVPRQCQRTLAASETVSVEQCVAIAHNRPSGAITYDRRDGGPQEAPPAVNVLRIRENGPYAVHAAVDLAGHGTMTRATLCRCGKSANKPFCDNSHRDAGFVASGEPSSIASDALENRDGPLVITPLADGPLQVLGNLEICAGTGRTVSRVENARLCRCGGSATKPFCDGTHARIGFRSEQPAQKKTTPRPGA